MKTRKVSFQDMRLYQLNVIFGLGHGVTICTMATYLYSFDTGGMDFKWFH